MTDFTEVVGLDATDLRILEQLQRDASLTNQALAAAVHTSPATCLRRVKRLMDTGVIERQVALLSPARLGAGLTAIVEVTLDRQGAEHLAAFEARAVADEAVRQCYRVSPGPDFLLILQVSDMPGAIAIPVGAFADPQFPAPVFSVYEERMHAWVGLPPGIEHMA